MLNFISAGSGVYFASMVNALQFILNLPLMSMIFPANVMTFMKTMIPIVMFDFLNDIPEVANLFGNDEG